MLRSRGELICPIDNTHPTRRRHPTFAMREASVASGLARVPISKLGPSFERPNFVCPTASFRHIHRNTSWPTGTSTLYAYCVNLCERAGRLCTPLQHITGAHLDPRPDADQLPAGSKATRTAKLQRRRCQRACQGLFHLDFLCSLQLAPRFLMP